MVYVQVLDRDGNVLSVGSKRDGIFGSINEAIEAISNEVNATFCFYSEYSFKVKLCGMLFDESVLIPEDLKLEFVTDSNKKSVIKSVKSKSVYSAFSCNIEIKKVVDGWMFLNEGEGSRTIVPDGIYQQFRKNNPDVITLGLTKDFIGSFKSLQNDVTRMILLLEEKTMSIQILGFTGSLKEDLLFIDKDISELDSVLDINRSEMGKLQGTVEYQKLLCEAVYNPKQRIERLNNIIDTKGFLKDSDCFSDIEENARKGNTDYVSFINEISFMIQELLHAYNYSLKKVIVNLKSINNDSFYLYRLIFIEELFKEIVVKFKVLSMYMHDISDENVILAKGDNSSAIVLELAENGLKGPNRNKCKHMLVEFLNKHTKTRFTMNSSNEDIVNALRDYTKDSADADYMLIRFIKDHPRHFAVVGAILSTLSILNPISIIAGWIKSS